MPDLGDGKRRDLLRAELDRQHGFFGRRRLRDKRQAFALQMGTVTLSAAITVLLGIQVSSASRTVLSNVALALGAIITVMSAAEAFFNHRGLWIARTTTVRNLDELRRKLDRHEAEIADGCTPRDTTNDLLAELEYILRADHDAWSRLRAIEPVSEKVPSRSDDVDGEASQDAG